MRDFSKISFNTKLCAVIGNPISHSMSPDIHNAGYEALDLDFVYFPCQVKDVKGALAGMRAMHNFRGLSVTIPHKMAVIPYLDEINEVDKHIGSINTIVKEGDKLIGLGTDGPGALKAFHDANVDFTDKVVLMIGCGGDLSKSTDKKITSSVLEDHSLKEAMLRSNIIINCTPIGMHPREDASVVPPELFRQGQVVFDAVYNPLKTKLLKDAEEKGCQTISGVEMFINQAVLQFEQFTGMDAHVEVMRKVVLDKLGN